MSLMNKKITQFKMITALVSLILIGCASSNVTSGAREIEMSYSRLQIMDLDQMSDLMQQKVRQFKSTNSLQPLQEGLQICLGRPDEDGLLEKVISIIKNPLEDNDAWESTIEETVTNSIRLLKSENAHPSDQVTSAVVLENIIAEFKPSFFKQYQSPAFETRIIERIASAEIEFSKAALSERKLNLMRSTSTPSAIAQRLIEIKTTDMKKKSKK